MLEWNSNTGVYEATFNGQLVQVDGDEFSEERSKLQREYQQSMDENAAYDKADAELRSVFAWKSDL